MVDVPEGWPPEEEQRATVVPLFPLPNVWLFPGAVLPLHIFEPRYRRMIEDSLDGPGRLVIGTVVEGHEGDMAGSPPCYPVAGLGEIGRHDRRPDGRFDIYLVGLARVRIREAESDRAYRRVEIQPQVEIDADSDQVDELRRLLVGSISERIEVQEGQTPLESMPVGWLADLLLKHTPLPHATFQRIYSELDVGARARRALEEHRRVSGNGDA